MTAQALEITLENAVFPKLFHHETVAMTDSLKVAEYFGKRHDNLLQRIENLGCSKEFNALNFKAVKYTDSKGEKRPLLRFMSLYDDNEPYPLTDVITLLNERIKRLESDVLQYPNNEAYHYGLIRAKSQLAKLIKLHKKELTQ